MAYDDKTIRDSGATQHDGASVRTSLAAIQKGALLLGTYRIESDAIHGGMGSVWRVRHTGWNTDLAMKRPQPQMFADEAAKENFINECQSWIDLGLHPNIVSCYYVREIEGVPTIFSEWMENGSLENHIQKGTLYQGTEGERQARLLDIAIQYARGLHYAHESGLIHQDVKPDNLLLTNDWQAKAADFGLAKARGQLTVKEESEDGGATQMAASGGYTPAYCSMEQMDGKALTRRTDIYSWGVSVMEMYLGARPWQNGVVAGMSCRDYFAESRVAMPEALQALLARCMESEPEKRPHDFALIEEELQSIYQFAVGAAYPRPQPKAAADTADSLNNRALTYLDLGLPEKAEEYWEEALASDRSSAIALYNQGLYRLRKKIGAKKDGYSISDEENEWFSRLYDAVSRANTADGNELAASFFYQRYKGVNAENHLSLALKLSAGPAQRQRVEAALSRVKRAWFELPIHPGTCLKIRFDADDQRCAAAWAVEGGGNYLAVYDLLTRRELRRKDLDECHVSSGFDRVILAGQVLYLLNGDAVYAFETATLNRRPDLEEDGPPPGSRDPKWPYVDLPDGLRSLIPMTRLERRGNHGVTVPRKDPATLWLDSLQPVRTGVGGFGGPPTAQAEYNGLKAALPAVGMDSGQYALSTSSDRRWLLFYEKPFYNDQKRTFNIVDTTVFGRLPEYAVARAASYAEVSGMQNERKRLLEAAEKCLDSRDLAGALEALEAAYALSPENPGERWFHLNCAAGRLPGAVRRSLRGTRKGDELSEHEIDTNPAHAESYGLGRDRSWEAHMDVLGRGGQNAAAAGGEPLRFEAGTDGRRCLLPGGREAATLPGVRLPEDQLASVYDAGRKTVYLCASGLFSAWDVKASPARCLGAVRFGAPPDAPLLPFRPWEKDTLWGQTPEQIILNRHENATVALIFGEVQNAYGQEQLTGFHAVTAVDLRTLHVLHTLFYHEERLVNMPQMTVANASLQDIGADGQLFLWSTVRGGLLWAITEPDRFQEVEAGISGDRIRRDGNAMIFTTTWSKNGNTYQQVLLDWEFAAGDGPAQFVWRDALPADEVLKALGSAEPPAPPKNGLDDLLAGLERQARSRLQEKPPAPKPADPMAAMLAEMERRARERIDKKPKK